MKSHSIHSLVLRLALIGTWPLMWVSVGDAMLPIGFSFLRYLNPVLYVTGFGPLEWLLLGVIVIGVVLTVISSASERGFLLPAATTTLGLSLVLGYALNGHEAIHNEFNSLAAKTLAPFISTCVWAVVASMIAIWARVGATVAVAPRSHTSLLIPQMAPATGGAASPAHGVDSDARLLARRSLHILSSIVLALQIPCGLFAIGNALSESIRSNWTVPDSEVLHWTAISCGASIVLGTALSWTPLIERDARRAHAIAAAVACCALLIGAPLGAWS